MLIGSLVLGQAFAEQLAANPEPVPLPPFTLQNAQGETFSSKSFRGNVVLVNFWAGWCPPCIEEFPSLQALKSHFADANFEILAINMGESGETIQTFAEHLSSSVNFPLLVDENISVAKAWGVKALPTTVLLNKHGEAVLSYTGDRDWNDEQAHAQVTFLLDE